jgi:hypothetical protein
LRRIFVCLQGAQRGGIASYETLCATPQAGEKTSKMLTFFEKSPESPHVRGRREYRDKYLEISLMNATEQARFSPLYESMERALKLQGKAKATKEAHSGAVHCFFSPDS